MVATEKEESWHQHHHQSMRAFYLLLHFFATAPTASFAAAAHTILREEVDNIEISKPSAVEAPSLIVAPEKSTVIPHARPVPRPAVANAALDSLPVMLLQAHFVSPP